MGEFIIAFLGLDSNHHVVFIKDVKRPFSYSRKHIYDAGDYVPLDDDGFFSICGKKYEKSVVYQTLETRDPSFFDAYIYDHADSPHTREMRDARIYRRMEVGEDPKAIAASMDWIEPAILEAIERHKTRKNIA